MAPLRCLNVHILIAFLHGGIWLLHLPVAFGQNNTTSATANSSTSQMPQQQGLSTSFLVKSHAILMTFSWLLFAPMAILFARFQRDPLRRLLGEQLWFQVHRLSNTLTVLFVLLAFICILSAMGGKWTGPSANNPITVYSIHSLFGFIAVLLVLSQPISALFRCHPDSTSRIVFNIWHSISGYLAWLCAVVAICIACCVFLPTRCAVCVFVWLSLMIICIGLMQFLAVQKSQLKIVDWIGQRQLYAAAALICLVSAFLISIFIIIG